MLTVGDRIGEATVWNEAREQVALRDFVRDGPVLFLFFLFAWSST